MDSFSWKSIHLFGAKNIEIQQLQARNYKKIITRIARCNLYLVY